MRSKLLGSLLAAVALTAGIMVVTAQMKPEAKPNPTPRPSPSPSPTPSPAHTNANMPRPTASPSPQMEKEMSMPMPSQPEDEGVRGSFLESRPKTTNLNAPSRRHRRRSPANTNANANTSSSSGANTNMTNANSNRRGSNKSNPAIGLGYTLFMRDADGRGVRVEPTRQFSNGDRVRLALETNTDGYLYIFDSEDGGPVRMIYPDARLDGGDNWIEAHVPMEIPSSDESEERLRWFEFYGKPGGDRIYVVVTREPLKSVPTSDELVAFCGLNKEKCPWQPPADVWAQVEKATKAQVKVATSKNFGQAQTETEKVATTRGLGLDKSAPQPSVIRINASTSEPLLVTVLDLVHK